METDLAQTAERRYLAFRVGRYRERGRLPLLLQLIKDPDDDVRAAAAWGLDQLGEQSTLPALINALYDPCFQVRSCAGWGLAHMGESAIEPVANVLATTRNPDTRDMAHMVMLHLGR